MSGYTLIDHVKVLDNKELGQNELLLLIAIVSYYNKDKGYAYPSYKQLKDRSRIADNRTLSKAMKLLISKKYIEKVSVKGLGNKYFINCEKVLYEPSGELHQVGNYTTCKNTLPPSGELHYDLVENYTTTNTNTNTNTNISSSTAAKKSYIDFFENNFHMPSSHEIGILNSFLDEGMSEDLIIMAMERAVENNVRNVKYVKAILQKWIENNITTPEAVKAEQLDFERSKLKPKEIEQSNMYLTEDMFS